MSDDKRIYESVKYTFSGLELQALGEELARATQAVFDLRGEKKQFDITAEAAIKGAEKKVAELTTRINLGSEMRDVEVMVLLETPRPGMKRVVRLDNNDTVRELPMTAEEMQQSFSFGAIKDLDPDAEKKPDDEDERDGKSRGSGE